MLKYRTITYKREKLGMTQKTLSQKTGIRPELLSRLENGKLTNPTLLTLEKLAKALECRVADLIDESVMVE